MSAVRRLLAILLLALCVSPGAAQAQGFAGKAIIVARVESAKMVALLEDVMPHTPDEIWHGEVYELDVTVLKVLGGIDPGDVLKVKVTTHAREFEGMLITLVIDPDLKLFVPGQSWWAQASITEPVCVPDELLKDSAYRNFVAKSFERDSHEESGERCVTL